MGEACGPHAKQAAFHALKQRIKMYRGGLGSGKTLCGSRELMATILEDHQHSQTLGGHNVGGRLYLVGAPTYDMIEVGPWYHLTQWLDSFERINGWRLDKRRWESHPRKIELVGDIGIIKFLSVDNPSRWAAATACSAWLDESELCKDSMGAFRMLQGRLRDNRAPQHKLIVTSSPRGQRGCAKMFQDKITEGDPDWGLVIGSSLDNPGNPQTYVADMMATMSESERRQQIDAELIADDNAIFGHEFDESGSMNNHFKYRKGGSQQFNLAIDWGGHFHALLICHEPEIGGDGTDTVIDEITAEGIQTEDFINLVDAMCRRHWGLQPGDIHEVVCDYNPREACQLAYKKWRGRVRHRRVRDNQDRWSRINTTRWRLQEAGTGLRRLFFHPGLRATKSNRGILTCMQNYALSERWIQGERVATDRPIQDSPYSHGADALAYYCWIRYSHKRFHDRNAVGVAA